MSKERLSRLQRWILKFLHNRENQVAWLTTLKYHACRSEGLFKPEASRASVDVTFSRSLRSLSCKDLIIPFGSKGKVPLKIDGMEELKDTPGMWAMNVKAIGLTDEGEAKAQELLNAKNEKLNNKKSEVNNE